MLAWKLGDAGESTNWESDQPIGGPPLRVVYFTMIAIGAAAAMYGKRIISTSFAKILRRTFSVADEHCAIRGEVLNAEWQLGELVAIDQSLT